MIDYEKLQQAHELAKNIAQNPDNGNFTTKISCNFYDFGNDFEITQNGVSMAFIDIDIMLKYLKEIGRPKFEVGQWVYILLNCFDIGFGKIDRHDDDYQIEYENGCFKVFEECFIFATKADLIQSQIDYWTSLKNEEISTHFGDMSTESDQDKRKIPKGSGRNLRNAREVASEYSTPIMQEPSQDKLYATKEEEGRMNIIHTIEVEAGGLMITARFSDDDATDSDNLVYLANWLSPERVTFEMIEEIIVAQKAILKLKAKNLAKNYILPED